MYSERLAKDVGIVDGVVEECGFLPLDMCKEILGLVEGVGDDGGSRRVNSVGFVRCVGIP